MVVDRIKVENVVIFKKLLNKTYHDVTINKIRFIHELNSSIKVIVSIIKLHNNNKIHDCIQASTSTRSL